MFQLLHSYFTRFAHVFVSKNLFADSRETAFVWQDETKTLREWRK